MTSWHASTALDFKSTLDVLPPLIIFVGKESVTVQAQ